MCVDMREANKAIRRENYPMPTIETCLNELNSILENRLKGLLPRSAGRRVKRNHNVHDTVGTNALQTVDVWRKLCPGDISTDNVRDAERM